MNEDTKKKLEEAVAACAKKAASATNAGDALHYTQAACNAANALACLHPNLQD